MSVLADQRADGWRWLAFGDTRWAVRELEEPVALEVAMPAGSSQAHTVRWPCWRYRDHIAALRAGMVAGANGEGSAAGVAPLSLDVPRYLSGLSAWAELDDPLRSDLLPVALWWAGGGDGAEATVPDAGGQTLIDGHAFAVRRWTHRERLASLLACLHEEGEGVPDGAGTRFDAVSYLDSMVRCAVTPGLAGADLDDLPVRWALPLIDAVVSHNVAPAQDDLLPGAGPRAQAAAAQTLSLCRALGWTPSQVWSAPAVEIDRLLALIDLAQHKPAAPPVRRSRRLADQPDAVVIRIED